jgi:hypothetical protein
MTNGLPIYDKIYLCIFPYFRKPFLKYDFVWINLNIRNFVFFFISAERRQRQDGGQNVDKACLLSMTDWRQRYNGRFSKLMTYERMGFLVNLPDVVLAPVVDEWSVLIQKGVL